MDADDKRKERLLQDDEAAEDHAHTVAGTGWRPHYYNATAVFPGAGRPPVTMITHDGEGHILIQENTGKQRWVPAHLLTPIGDH